MQLDLVVIRLAKKGFENKPSYSLTVYGNGKAVYESQTEGKIEKDISQEQVLSVFSSLKDSGFFMMDDGYNIDENGGKSYNEIYVEMPGQDNTTKKKKINYYDDYDIPVGVLSFEETQSGKHGTKFETKINDDNYVLVPGVVKKLKFASNEDGKSISEIERLIRDSEKPELEVDIRKAGYTDRIVYWDPDEFI